ncbi:hypothetical protein [Sulfitobacter noctilucae]|uniref:hypothetical protein n=1 Tax=Sulfitobacter noctilucae TaxID=1342302 RepID=UPI00046A946C|nr:hypothetical protein [Sulfitobacter noctilucae]
MALEKPQTSRIVLSASQMRYSARRWHAENPEFTLNILTQMGRCKTPQTREQAMAFHSEALAVGFWSKKDIVQYVVACLHAKGSMCDVASFRRFIENYTEADQDIMQAFIDSQPIHYWTYVSEKGSVARRDSE